MDHSSSDGSPHANFKGVLRHETCQVDGRQNRIDTHLNEVRKLWLSLEAKNSRFGGGGEGQSNVANKGGRLKMDEKWS